MPSPWIIRSVAAPVVCAEPWVKLPRVAATWTPSPTWIGLVPPLPAPAAPAPRMTWLRVSWKTVVEALKPTVLALAMLLPVTSSIVWLARRPLMPEKSERSLVGSFRTASGRGGVGGVGRRGCGGRGGADGEELGERDLAAVDVEDGALRAEGHARDDAGVGGDPVGVDPGDALADHRAGAERHLRPEQRTDAVGDVLHLLQRGELRRL